jgi:transcriptional regulator with XRE-family HTH domain
MGSRIKAARKRAGLSHDRLGALVGTSRQHLIRLEKDLHTPREGMVRRIAEATGQPMSFFESEDDDDEESDLSLDDLLRLRVRQIIREEALQ